jgi:hypothetical protein
MKMAGHPDAKIVLWARQRAVVRLPRIANLPRFGSRKFDSYGAFNAWKNELILELARRGGAKWTA